MVVHQVGERYTGARVKRSEDQRILTGQGRYVDDVKLPGMLHAAFVRSPLAHGRITRVDVEAARTAPGVVAVYTGEDMQGLLASRPPGMFGGAAPSYTLLCTDKVRLVGDPVVLVVAESRYLAEDACELVEVDYDDLPAVTSARVAFDAASGPVFDDWPDNAVPASPPAVYGDVDAAFAKADRVFTETIHVHRHQNVPMEGRATVASFDPDAGELTIHAAAQGVQMVLNNISTQLGIPREQVHVRAGDIGGSFGLKMGISREEIVTAAASKDLGRPVKWIEDRNENLTVSGQAREESFDVEVAVTDDGRVLAMKVKMTLDAGAYPGMGGMVGNIIQSMMPGPYRMEGLAFESLVAVTNKAHYVAYRGPWASETFVRERLFDLIAEELGIEPYELRLRNVADNTQPPAKMITGRALVGVTARDSLERLAEVVDFADFRLRQAAARAEGRYLGLGMATYIEAAPGPRGEGPLGRETMRARLEADGTVSVFTGQMPHGQGHQTTFAQIAADEFGVPFEDVRIVVGDSDVVPGGMTGGSRAATMAGGASLHVARELRKRVLEAASDLLEANVDDLEIVDRAVAVKGTPASAMGLSDVAAASTEALEVSFEFDGGQGGWSGGTHCAEVEVDPDTGIVHIHRYVVVEDCGALINPAIVEGQVRGGVAQGVGAVLLERSAYDDDGNFLAGSFMDYLLPTTTEVPRIDIEHLETIPLDPDVNFRGVGEGGMIVTPPTICNAISDALSPFGVRITEQHLPPSRLLELMGVIDSA